MRVAIATFCLVPKGPLTRKYTDLARLSRSAWHAFGQRHAVPVLDVAPALSETDACWEKLSVLIRALEQYDQVLWVDCDTIPLTRQVPDWLFRPSGTDVLVQCPEAYGKNLGWSADLARSRMAFNSGVMLLRATSAVFQWLEAAYMIRKQSSYQGVWSGVGEQEALWDLARNQFADLSIGYAADMQCHPADARLDVLCAHLYGDHATQIFDRQTCDAVFSDWRESVRLDRPARSSLALLHWCAIQRCDATDPIDRGGPERFLYETSDLAVPAGLLG